MLKNNLRKPTQKKTQLWQPSNNPTPTQSVAPDSTKVLLRPPFRSWVCHVAAILCHDAPRPTKRNATTKGNKQINGSIVCEPEIELLGGIIFQLLV